MPGRPIERRRDPYPWSKRRRYLYVLTAFCMAVIVYVLVTGRTSAVAETSVTMAFTALIGFAASFVFGAAWQDTTAIKAKAAAGGDA